LYSLGFGAQVHELQQHLEADGGTKAVGSADTPPQTHPCVFLLINQLILWAAYLQEEAQKEKHRKMLRQFVSEHHVCHSFKLLEWGRTCPNTFFEHFCLSHPCANQPCRRLVTGGLLCARASNGTTPLVRSVGIPWVEATGWVNFVFVLFQRRVKNMVCFHHQAAQSSVNSQFGVDIVYFDRCRKCPPTLTILFCA